MPSAVHTAYNIVYTDSIEHCENLKWWQCIVRTTKQMGSTILFGCQDFFGYLFIQISRSVLLLGVVWGNGVIIYSFRFKSNLTLLFSAGESASLLSADLNTRII